MAWKSRAACRGVDSVVFYPADDQPDAVERARAICDGCEVRAECLEHALGFREAAGVWGGTTERERRRILRQRRRTA